MIMTKKRKRHFSFVFTFASGNVAIFQRQWKKMKAKRVHKILRSTIISLLFNENWSLTLILEKKSENKHLRTKCVERELQTYTPFL